MTAKERMLKAGLFATAAMLCVGCSQNEPRLDVGVAATSFNRVLVAGGAVSIATIPFDVKNSGDATALVQACDNRISATIQKRVNGRWEPSSSGICLANVSWAPVALREGARNHGEVGIAEPGRYRVRIFYTPDASGGYSKSSASGAFDVR